MQLIVFSIFSHAIRVTILGIIAQSKLHSNVIWRLHHKVTRMSCDFKAEWAKWYVCECRLCAGCAGA